MHNKKNDENDIYIMYNNVLYNFLKLWRGDDGSLYSQFMHTRRTTQQLKLNFAVGYDGGAVSSHIAERYDTKTQTEPIRISYHTSGAVVCHGLERKTVYLDPLVNITNDNTFFMMSIPSISSLDVRLDEAVQQSQVIPIKDFSDQRVNIYLSVIPPKFPDLDKIDGLWISADFQIATFVVVGEIDKQTFNFGEHVPKETFLFYTPGDGHYRSQSLSKNEAFLQYKHKIYQTNEVIILSPNNDGVLRVIFTVEMRIPPFIRIEFDNDNHEIRNVCRSQVDIKFKVFDKKKKQFVKKTEEVIIKSIQLDANIYAEDDILPPEGFI